MRKIQLLSYRITLLFVAIVFLCSCTSRQWITPQSPDLASGDTVYRVVTLEADTITFVGRLVGGVEHNELTGEDSYRFDGDGAVFSDGIISGLCDDGSKRDFTIPAVNLIEIERHDTRRTVLLTASAITAAGFILYAIINASSDEQIDPPCGK